MRSKRVGIERMSAEMIALKDRILGYQETIKSLRSSLKSSEAAREKRKDTYEVTIAEKDAIIKELTNKIAHMAAVAAHDGTNTGTSTAATPINKKKNIPILGVEAIRGKVANPDTKDISWKLLKHLKLRISPGMYLIFLSNAVICVVENS